MTTKKKSSRTRAVRKGGAPAGNQFWKLRSSHGRKPIFANPDDLWSACVEYFQWVETNPLQEEKVFQYQGKVVRANVTKMRAMTKAGLCLFLGISDETWRDYRTKQDFSGVCEGVEAIIWEQKFTGAAADLLNPAIIARELGLRDGQELTGAGGGPIHHESTPRITLSPDEQRQAIESGLAKIMRRG